MKVAVYVVQRADTDALSVPVCGSLLDAIAAAVVLVEPSPKAMAQARGWVDDDPRIADLRCEVSIVDDSPVPDVLEVRVETVGPVDDEIEGDSGRGWWGSAEITRVVVDAEPVP